MKTERTTTVVEDLGQKLVLEGVVIDGHEWQVTVDNFQHSSGRDSGLGVTFRSPGSHSEGSHYSIWVLDGTVQLKRHVFRPNHDHDAEAYLVSNEPENASYWGPLPNGRTTFWASLPFGSVEVDD